MNLSGYYFYLSAGTMIEIKIAHTHNGLRP